MKMMSRNPFDRPSAEDLLDEYFLSDKMKEVLKWKNYSLWLEKKMKTDNPQTTKKGN
jgi:hypothetical protein